MAGFHNSERKSDRTKSSILYIIVQNVAFCYILLYNIAKNEMEWNELEDIPERN